MSIMFMTTPLIMAFYAGLEETEVLAALISGPSWLPATGYSCIALGNAGNIFRRSVNPFGRSQREPGVLKLDMRSAASAHHDKTTRAASGAA